MTDNTEPTITCLTIAPRSTTHELYLEIHTLIQKSEYARLSKADCIGTLEMVKHDYLHDNAGPAT